jgi:dCMP deaminase
MSDWNKYFMEIAHKVALKSRNESTKVGCLIVDEKNTIISSGFNDFPLNADLKYMTNERPMCYLIDVHAEMRALINAGRSVAGCKAFVTIASCENCFKHLIVAGISQVIYDSLFTNRKSTSTPERLEAIIRLTKATGIQQRNLQGKTLEEDLKDNGIEINF